jgi:hypothetical protein
MLLRAIEESDAALLNECAIPAHPALRRHLKEHILPGLALYRVLLAEEAGLFHERHEWLQGRIVFPDLNRSGAVLHMIGRAPKRDAALRYLSLPGLPKTIWGLANLRRSQPVILTESIIDAVNLRQMGFQGMAVGGTSLAAHLAEQLNRSGAAGGYGIRHSRLAARSGRGHHCELATGNLFGSSARSNKLTQNPPRW